MFYNADMTKTKNANATDAFKNAVLSATPIIVRDDANEFATLSIASSKKRFYDIYEITCLKGDRNVGSLVFSVGTDKGERIAIINKILIKSEELGKGINELMLTYSLNNIIKEQGINKILIGFNEEQSLNRQENGNNANHTKKDDLVELCKRLGFKASKQQGSCFTQEFEYNPKKKCPQMQQTSENGALFFSNKIQSK